MNIIEQINDADAKLKSASDKQSVIDSFTFLVECTKGGDAEQAKEQKTLAARIMPKYFAHYPALYEEALNAQFDLCEDEDASIRLEAIRGLAVICKNAPVFTQRNADVLGQLLSSEDAEELKAVRETFMKLFGINASASFTALLTALNVDASDALRAFLKQQLQHNRVLIKSDEDLQLSLARDLKAVLTTETSTKSQQEFALYVRTYSKIPMISESPESGAELSKIIETYAGVDSDFDAANEEALEKFFYGTAMITTTKGAEITTFANYFFKAFFSESFALLSTENQGKMLRAGKIICEKADAAVAKSHLAAVFTALKAAIPLDTKTSDATINFSTVDALLVMFHHLIAKNRGFIRALTGYFIPCGQPSDIVTEAVAAQRADFTDRMNFLNSSIAGAVKSVTNESKENSSQISTMKDATAEEKAPFIALSKGFKKQKAIIEGCKFLVAPLVIGAKATYPKFVTTKNYTWTKPQQQKQKQKQKQQKGENKENKGGKQQKNQQNKGQKRKQGQQVQQQGKKQKQNNQNKNKNRNNNNKNNNNNNNNQNQNQNKKQSQKKKSNKGQQQQGQKRKQQGNQQQNKKQRNRSNNRR